LVVEKGKEDCVESVVDEGSLGDGSDVCVCVEAKEVVCFDSCLVLVVVLVVGSRPVLQSREQSSNQ
jgi:hypothetical protein